LRKLATIVCITMDDAVRGLELQQETRQDDLPIVFVLDSLVPMNYLFTTNQADMVTIVFQPYDD
jgi:hypothetical protein